MFEHSLDSRAQRVARVAAWFLLLILLLLCAACAGRGAAGTADVAADAIGAKPPPAAELAQLLTAELARLAATGRQPSAVAWGEDCRALYGTAEYLGADWPVPPDKLVLTWVEQFTGDCDQDGWITAADLTPIAQHWQEPVEYDPPEQHDGLSWWPAGDPLGDGAQNWRLARIDGNHDGLIDIGDITPIAQHWNQRIDGYMIHSFDGFDFSVSGPEKFTLGLIERESSLQAAGDGPRIHRAEFDLCIDPYDDRLELQYVESDWSHTISDYQSVLPASLYLRPVAAYRGVFGDWFKGQGSLPLTLENPRPGWQRPLWLERDGQSMETMVLDMTLLPDGRLAQIVQLGQHYEEAQFALTLHDPLAGTVECFVWPESASFFPHQLVAGPDGTIWVAATDAYDYADGLMLLRLDQAGNLLAGVRLFSENEDGLRVHRDPQIVALDDGGVLVASAEGGHYGDLVLRRFDAQGSLLWERAWVEEYYPSSSYYGFEVNSLLLAVDGRALVGGTYCPIGATQDLPCLASFDQDGGLRWIQMFDGLHSHSVTDIVEVLDGSFSCVLRADSYGGSYNPTSRIAGITPDGELAWQLTPAGHMRLKDAEAADDGTIWAAGSIEAEGGGIEIALLRLNSDGGGATVFRRLYPFAVPGKYVGGDIDELELGSSMFIAFGGHANAYGWEGSKLEILDPELELTLTGCREEEVDSDSEEYIISLAHAAPADPSSEVFWTSITERVF